MLVWTARYAATAALIPVPTARPDEPRVSESTTQARPVGAARPRSARVTGKGSSAASGGPALAEGQRARFRPTARRWARYVTAAYESPVEDDRGLILDVYV